MRVTLCSLTYNRNKCLQRILRSFIEQEFDGEKLTLFIFNSGHPTTIPNIKLAPNKEIILVNRQTSLQTGNPYSSIGEKCIDALSLIPECDIVVHADCDDIYLPNYAQDGMEGMEKAYAANMLAFKPMRSVFSGPNGYQLMENTFEPSIFVDYKHLKEHLYYLNNVQYHFKWLNPLVYSNKILVDKDSKPGFIYDWSGEYQVYKMSGKADNEANFKASQKIEADIGNGITEPLEKEKFWKYISKANELINKVF